MSIPIENENFDQVDFDEIDLDMDMVENISPNKNSSKKRKLSPNKKTQKVNSSKKTKLSPNKKTPKRKILSQIVESPYDVDDSEFKNIIKLNIKTPEELAHKENEDNKLSKKQLDDIISVYKMYDHDVSKIKNMNISEEGQKILIEVLSNNTNELIKIIKGQAQGKIITARKYKSVHKEHQNGGKK
jgi:hypothetical protein